MNQDMNTVQTANMQRAAKAVKVDPVTYSSTVPSMRFVFKAGKTAHFIGGEFTTNMQHEQEELQHEIDSGNQHIYIDKNKKVKEVIEPMEALRARFIAEYKAELEASTDKSNDAGNSDPQKLTPANSTTVAEGAAGSDSNGNAAPATGAAGKLLIAPKQ